MSVKSVVTYYCKRLIIHPKCFAMHPTACTKAPCSVIRSNVRETSTLEICLKSFGENSCSHPMKSQGGLEAVQIVDDSLKYHSMESSLGIAGKKMACSRKKDAYNFCAINPKPFIMLDQFFSFPLHVTFLNFSKIQRCRLIVFVLIFCVYHPVQSKRKDKRASVT